MLSAAASARRIRSYDDVNLFLGTGRGGRGIPTSHVPDEKFVLAAHLRTEVAEIETEKKEPLHGDEEVAQHREEAVISRQRGHLEVEARGSCRGNRHRTPSPSRCTRWPRAPRGVRAPHRWRGSPPGPRHESRWRFELEAVGDLFGRDRADEVSLVWNRGEQPFLLEPAARLSHRHPAGAVGIGQGLLGESGARTVTQGDDVPLQRPIDSFSSGPAGGSGGGLESTMERLYTIRIQRQAADIGLVNRRARSAIQRPDSVRARSCRQRLFVVSYHLGVTSRAAETHSGKVAGAQITARRRPLFVWRATARERETSRDRAQ